MKLRQLQCLCAVVDADFNLSRAAILLHQTQPAVSKQLRQLEEELGLDLLLRHGGRALGLTEAGEQTVGWARRALQSVENIRTLARERRGDAGGCIQLVTSPTHAKYVLLPVIHAFSRRHPKVRIEVKQGSPDQAVELVSEGQATLGVISLSPSQHQDVLAVPFRSSTILLIARRGHPLLKHRSLTLDKMCAYPFILVHPSALGEQVLERFRAAGLDLNVAVHAVNADMTKDFVLAGLGVGLIPTFAFLAARDRGLAARDASHLFEPVVSSVLLRRRSHLPQYVYDFLQMLDASLDRERMEPLIFERE